MPLDTLDTKSRNIHQFAITEPEKAAVLPFDPNRDISNLDWRAMKDYYFRLGTGSVADKPDAVRTAFQLSVLFPFRKNELKLDGLWTSCIREVVFQNRAGDLFNDDILSVLGIARSLLPTEYSQIASDSEYLANLQDQCRRRKN